MPDLHKPFMHTSPPPVVVSSLPVSPIFRRPLHHAALRSAAIRANSSRRARDQRLCQESWRLLWDNAGLSDQATPGERRLAGSDEKQTHYSTEREREGRETSPTSRFGHSGFLLLLLSSSSPILLTCRCLVPHYSTLDFSPFLQSSCLVVLLSASAPRTSRIMLS